MVSTDQEQDAEKNQSDSNFETSEGDSYFSSSSESSTHESKEFEQLSKRKISHKVSIVMRTLSLLVYNKK